MASQWTRNQVIAVLAIIVPAVIAIITLFIQVQGLEQKIQPVIEMKPQIINVNNNITRVEKEIANFHDFMMQQDRLRVIEEYTKNDLDIRFKKIIVPPVSRMGNFKGILMFELKQIPFENSVSVTRQDGLFLSGDVPPGPITIVNNIVMIKCIDTMDHMLESENSFYDISYLPDSQTNKRLVTLKGVSCNYSTADPVCTFHPKI